VALCPRDLEASLRFYRAGIGLEVLMDEVIRDEWKAFFGARSDRLRSVFLGDPKRPEAGIVELVAFDAGVEAAPGVARPSTGFFLLSFLVDVEATLARLASLGLDSEARVLATRFGAKIAVVRDPDGVLVELIPAAPVPGGPCGDAV
jgi:glyoxylase I family protein